MKREGTILLIGIFMIANCATTLPEMDSSPPSLVLSCRDLHEVEAVIYSFPTAREICIKNHCGPFDQLLMEAQYKTPTAQFYAINLIGTSHFNRQEYKKALEYFRILDQMSSYELIDERIRILGIVNYTLGAIIELSSPDFRNVRKKLKEVQLPYPYEHLRMLFLEGKKNPEILKRLGIIEGEKKELFIFIVKKLEGKELFPYEKETFGTIVAKRNLRNMTDVMKFVLTGSMISYDLVFKPAKMQCK